MSRKTLIFGGFGFIGRATAKKLREHGRYVIDADNRMICPEQGSKAHESVICDVRNADEVRRVLLYVKPEEIVWMPAAQGYGDNWGHFSDVQLTGTYSLFGALNSIEHRPEHIALISSQAVYEPRVRAQEGRTTLDPPSVYGQSKLQQEKAFRWFCRLLGIELTTIRPSIVLGPGQALQSTESGILRNWYHAMRAGKTGEIYGTGHQVRDFVHVDEVAELIQMALSTIPTVRTFNAAGHPMEIAEVSAIWEELSGGRNRLLGYDVRPGGEYSLTSDESLARECFGWKPRKSVRMMISEFLDSTMPAVVR